MKERAILFSGPMIRKVRAGLKSQTRRALRPQPTIDSGWEDDGGPGWGFLWKTDEAISQAELLKLCPYGAPGDRLVVKEATWIWCEKKYNGSTKTGRQKFRYEPVGNMVVYCADNPKKPEPINATSTLCWKYKPGRFMPRWASRITLQIEKVRVERVQEISEKDAEAEGAYPLTATSQGGGDSYCLGFWNLWTQINGPESWDGNPFVWAIDFTPIT